MSVCLFGPENLFCDMGPQFLSMGVGSPWRGLRLGVFISDVPKSLTPRHCGTPFAGITESARAVTKP